MPSAALRGAALVAAAIATLFALGKRVHPSPALVALLCGAVAVSCAGVTLRLLARLRAPLRPVLVLGPYTLLDKIGQGAAGVVYLAHHALLRRPAAVKLLAPARGTARDQRRFEREVRLTSRLTHPNTVAIYDFGRSADGLLYYAMEYIAGVSLEQLVQRDGPQPAWRVIHILRQVCGALDEAHRAGLIHRDIKPANLMLCARRGVPDVLKVVDFGLARPVAPDEGTSSICGDIVGTPLYMSPEALTDPARVDARSDLYSLGATGYFLLAGTPVFRGQTVVAICSKHLGEPPEPLARRLGAPVAADLEAVLLRCLAKSPADRPSSAAEVEALLAACASATEWSPARVEGWYLKAGRAGRA